MIDLLCWSVVAPFTEKGWKSGAFFSKTPRCSSVTRVDAPVLQRRLPLLAALPPNTAESVWTRQSKLVEQGLVEIVKAEKEGAGAPEA